MADFEPGKSYPIETLPDDLHDEKPAREIWAIRGALFWNECQGWWHERSITDYWHTVFGSTHVARFWQPMPADPMTREAILAERGEVICPKCDWAVDPLKPHNCRATG